ncbi:arginase [Alkalispirochaeta odontotermitis]|nr:arginase [Alkalispirochaeta odontotermitis]CAB1074080.1 Arginase/agmatinase/formimionoglutamate hydrolase, arginase family [Olavius algarvensis Delta 1 endosymbiont]
MLKTIPPRSTSGTFLNFPLCKDIDSLEADIAILGIPYGDPYSMEEVSSDSSNAPAAIRRESQRLSIGLNQWDFDLGGPLFDGQNIRVVDCGDIPGDPADIKGHYRTAEAVVKAILSRKALPVILGGDHGVPIPVFRAFDGYGPITLVQIDAHIDWRDEIHGLYEGYSSPIRRASELSHIDRIFQVGMRGQGSARAKEVEDALAYGAQIITAYDVHEHGMDAILDRIPANERYYLTIDADGLDPTVMPAVGAPAAGGLLFHQVRTLIHGLVKMGKLLGMDIVEITPRRDINGMSSLTAGQLILNFIGAAVRAGYFG